MIKCIIDQVKFYVLEMSLQFRESISVYTNASAIVVISVAPWLDVRGSWAYSGSEQNQNILSTALPALACQSVISCSVIVTAIVLSYQQQGL